MGLLSRRTQVQAPQVARQKLFTLGQNWVRLATLITVVESVARQFKPNLLQAHQAVQMQHFTLGQSSNDFIGGGFATTDFFNNTNNLEWKHHQQ